MSSAPEAPSVENDRERAHVDEELAGDDRRPASSVLERNALVHHLARVEEERVAAHEADGQGDENTVAEHLILIGMRPAPPVTRTRD